MQMEHYVMSRFFSIPRLKFQPAIQFAHFRKECECAPFSEFYYAKAEYNLVGDILKNLSKMHVAGFL